MQAGSTKWPTDFRIWDSYQRLLSSPAELVDDIIGPNGLATTTQKPSPASQSVVWSPLPKHNGSDTDLEFCLGTGLQSQRIPRSLGQGDLAFPGNCPHSSSSHAW